MSFIGKRGGGGQPVSPGFGSSHVISAISKKSRFCMRFTSLVGRDTSRTNGPGLSTAGVTTGMAGVVPDVGFSWGVILWVATSARMLRLFPCPGCWGEQGGVGRHPPKVQTSFFMCQGSVVGVAALPSPLLLNT